MSQVWLKNSHFVDFEPKCTLNLLAWGILGILVISKIRWEELKTFIEGWETFRNMKNLSYSFDDLKPKKKNKKDLWWSSVIKINIKIEDLNPQT